MIQNYPQVLLRLIRHHILEKIVFFNIDHMTEKNRKKKCRQCDQPVPPYTFHDLDRFRFSTFIF